MAWDAARGRVVLFGGRSTFDGRIFYNLADTWEWDGETWTAASPTNGPSQRLGHAMAYDAQRGKIVLFGGSNGTGGITGKLTLSDTWEWDGTGWTLAQPLTAPAPRDSHAMAWDRMRSRVVLFGGLLGAAATPNAETWEWDGAAWSLRASVTSPGARGLH